MAFGSATTNEALRIWLDSVRETQGQTLCVSHTTFTISTAGTYLWPPSANFGSVWQDPDSMRNVSDSDSLEKRFYEKQNDLLEPFG